MCAATFLHHQFGINTFTGQEHGTGDNKQPPSKFNAPAGLSTDQWVEACAAMGGTYAVFTAKVRSCWLAQVAGMNSTAC